MSMMISNISLLVALFVIVTYATAPTSKATCTPDDDVCEIFLVVQEYLTMTWQNSKLYPHKGKLFKSKEIPRDNATKVSLS